MKPAIVLAVGVLFSTAGLAGDLGYGAGIESYWRHDLDTGEDDESEFAIQRVTLDLTGSFDNVGGRLALEATAPAGPVTITYLRYAYASVGDVLPGVEFQVGLIPMSYVTWSDERAWPFRFISMGLAEREVVEFPSDLGVAVEVDLSNVVRGLRGRLTVTNGEGWTTAEDDPYKAYTVAAEYMPGFGPLRGFSGMVYYRRGVDDASDDLQDRFGVGAAYEYGHLLGASLQYMSCKDGPGPTDSNGWSAAGWYSLLPDRKLMLVLRHDEFDPDADTADNEHGLTIAGVGGEVGKFTWSIDYQTVTDELAPANDDESIYFHTSVRF